MQEDNVEKTGENQLAIGRRSSERGGRRSTFVLALTALGAYTNIAAYGFRFSSRGDYSFLLPLMYWLRDPSLYPGDVLRGAWKLRPSVRIARGFLRGI